MVTGVARTWAVHGQRSLAERWDEASKRLEQLGGVMTFGPRSETTLLDMQKEIARLLPPVPHDPALDAAFSALWDSAHRYWNAYNEIVESQKKLGRMRESGVHKILGHITPSMFEERLRPQDVLNKLFGTQRQSPPSPHGLCIPEFTSVSDYRAAERKVTACAVDLEDDARRIHAVFSFEAQAKEDQNRALILSLADQIDRLTARVGALTSQVSDLIEQLSTTVPKPKPVNQLSRGKTRRPRAA